MKIFENKKWEISRDQSSPAPARGKRSDNWQQDLFVSDQQISDWSCVCPACLVSLRSITSQMAHHELLQRNKDLICQQLLSRESSLLENLVSSGLFKIQEVEMMKSTKDFKAMGDTFVRLISEKGPEGFQHFCSELKKEKPSVARTLMSSPSLGSGTDTDSRRLI